MFKYNNIGSKIKALARAVFITNVVLVCIALLVGLIAIFANIASWHSYYDGGDYARFFLYILLGIAAGFVFLLLVWISTWALYGFGELIETNKQIAESSAAIAKNTALKETEDAKPAEELT